MASIATPSSGPAQPAAQRMSTLPVENARQQQLDLAAERKRRLYLHRIATAKSLIQLGSRPNANLDHAETLLRDAANMLEGWIGACYYDDIASDDDSMGYDSMDENDDDDDDEDMDSIMDADELSTLFDEPNDKNPPSANACSDDDEDDFADDISFDDMSTISGCRESLLRQQRLQEQVLHQQQPCNQPTQPHNLPIPTMVQTSLPHEALPHHPEDDLDAPFIVLLAQARHRLGQIALQRGQLVHASQLLLQVVLHDPQTLSPSALAMTWYDIALVYLRYGKSDQASVALRQASAIITGQSNGNGEASDESGNLLLMFVRRAMKRLSDPGSEGANTTQEEPLPWSRQFTVVTYNYDGSNGDETASHHPQYQQQQQQPSLTNMNVAWWECSAPPAAGAA